MRLAIGLALALMAALPVAAQTQPEPGTGDPRIQTVTYDPDQVIRLQGAPGYQINIEFAPDEQIENVAIGDSGAWQATANRRGDHLFVKPIQAGVTTNMTVVTTVRVYLFELTPAFDNVPFTLRFRYPSTEAAAEETAAPQESGRYRMSGSRTLWPRRISDDGIHTYIDFPAESALPAIYAVDARGRETLVNGGMRDGLFVIDSVQPRLVFRIDRHVARAARIAPRAED